MVDDEIIATRFLYLLSHSGLTFAKRDLRAHEIEFQCEKKKTADYR